MPITNMDKLLEWMEAHKDGKFFIELRTENFEDGCFMLYNLSLRENYEVFKEVVVTIGNKIVLMQRLGE